MKQKYKVVVRQNDIIVDIVFRVLNTAQIGNFNPIFCTYQKKEYLVKSIEGDLSDPFRRNDTYLNSLYIELAKK